MQTLSEEDLQEIKGNLVMLRHLLKSHDVPSGVDRSIREIERILGIPAKES